MTRLLDANVLIALYFADHVHHRATSHWFGALKGAFATCPIVEGALARWLVRIDGRQGAVAVSRELHKLSSDPRHRFWPDDVAYAEVNWHGVLGHHQVTDAYLAALARKHKGRLATLDRGLAALHQDVCELIPTENP